jgi:hypothetical protein
MNHHSSTQSGNSASTSQGTNDLFLASIPPLTAPTEEVRAWLFTWFGANYLFLDPEGATNITSFLSKIKLTGRDIRNFDKVGLHRYFSGRSGRFQHKELLEELAVDVQKAKGLEFEVGFQESDLCDFLEWDLLLIYFCGDVSWRSRGVGKRR